MSDTLERLETALIGPDEYPASDLEREAFAITDHDTASWASRKLQKAYREIEIISEWEAREVERVKTAAESERNRWKSSIDFLEGKLTEFLVGLRKAGRKTKTLNLPGGKFSLRSRQDSYTYDESAAIAWLKEHEAADGIVKTKESIDKTALKNAVTRTEEGQIILKETGEVIDWLSIAEQPDSAGFSPADDEKKDEG